MEYAKVILFQSTVMFILIAFGFFLYKKGVFTKRGGKQLSNFVIGAVCPVLIFSSFQKELEPRLVKGLALSFAASLIAHVVLILLGSVMFRKRNRGDNYGIEQFATAYSNCGFLGIPLVQAVFGSDGVFYVTAYLAFFNLLSWTHGIMVMTEKVSIKSALHALKAPAVIATIVGAVFFFLRIKLPSIVMEPVNYIASLNTPLAMIVSGITIAQSDVRKAIKKKGIYLTCFAKLLLGPVLVMFVLLPFRSDEVLYNTILIAASAPTAASTVMFAARYGKDNVYAAEIFAVSTAASIVTMPMLLILSGLLLSVI